MNRLGIVLGTVVWLTGCNRPSIPVETPPAEHYRLEVTQDGNAWRLDTTTGEIDKCWQGMATLGNVTCYPATFPKR